MFIKPPHLAKGDTIALTSPSAPLAAYVKHRVERCVSFLEKKGYRVIFSKHALSAAGYVSASGKERAEEFHQLFSDNSVKAIISLIGGYHCNQMIPYLDFQLLRKNPKIFVGFSDVTVFQMAALAKADLVTFYGPAGLTQFGEFPEPHVFTTDHFFKVLGTPTAAGLLPSSPLYTDEFLDWFTQQDNTRPRTLRKAPMPTSLRGGTAEGPLVGGCLSSLLHLRGTEFWPNFQGAVLLLETPEGHNLGEGISVSRIDMELADLQLSKVFEVISGIAFGRPYCTSEKDSAAILELLMQYTSKKPVPIVANLDLGHTDPMVTLPLGCKVRIDGDSASLSILESGVS